MNLKGEKVRIFWEMVIFMFYISRRYFDIRLEILMKTTEILREADL
jgi:hypothetical protein